MDDRTPPHSEDAEQAVLGSCLIDPSAIGDIGPILAASDFHSDKNRAVYEAMLALAEQKVAIDQVVLGQELTRRGFGELSFLSHLVATTPTSVHARYYAGVVAKLAYSRRVIQAGGKLAALGYEAEPDTDVLYGKCLKIMQALEPQTIDQLVEPKEQAERMMTMLTDRREQRVTPLSFGFKDMDRVTGGMQPGNLVIVGARPGVGKSQLLQEVVRHVVAIEKSVLIVSLEMTIEEWAEREIAMATGISVAGQRNPDSLTDDQWGQIQDVAAEIAGQKRCFLEGKMNFSTILQQAHSLHRIKGLDMVVFDYVQLAADGAGKGGGDTIREKVGYISRGLKNLARELKIVVLAASQLNRDVEGRMDKRPGMSDLKESGDLEQDADIILLLHQPAMYDKKAQANLVECYIPKVRQRVSKEKVVKLAWREDWYQHGDWSKEE